jgi:serine/threonine-protein kinase
MESYDQALNDYDYALKYAPGDIDILNMRINIYLKDQKYEQALKDINQLIKVDPDNATYRKMGGETCFLMGDYENAIVFYTDAIEKLVDTTGQTDGELLYNRGLSLLQVGKFEDGESDFTKAIGLDYSADESYFQRGLCRYAQHNYSGAIEDFKNYEAAYSDNKEDDFVYYLADSYYKSEQPALAVPYFQKCIEKNIMPGTCNYYLAGIALDAEDYEASIDYYTKAIEQKSQIIPSTFNRAIAYLHLDDTNAAIKDFQAVIDDGSNEELIDKAINVLNQINN